MEFTSKTLTWHRIRHDTTCVSLLQQLTNDETKHVVLDRFDRILAHLGPGPDMDNDEKTSDKEEPLIMDDITIKIIRVISVLGDEFTIFNAFKLICMMMTKEQDDETKKCQH